ncbi:response regulator transcription factor [Chloroflexota bacterium]
MKILLIEDNSEIVDIVIITIQLRWPEVTLISTFLGNEGVELTKTEQPDLIILDLGLPDIDGFQVLSQIRDFSDVPVAILTVRGEEMDKIKGLELGADDYITKPFSPGELLARMKALLRRSSMSQTTGNGDDKLSVPSIKGKLRIDFTSGEVSIGDRLLKLSPREYELLHLLVTNEGVVLSKHALLKKVFPDQGEDTRFVDVYINKLRGKLGENPEEPRMILNDGETGYKFVR